jgi:NADPH2:quinone reductase
MIMSKHNMQAVVIREPGGPEVLTLTDRPIPIPGNGEYLIRVKAAGVNRPDIAQREGKYPAPPGAPEDIPGLEVAGIIESSGGGTSLYSPGEKVCALLTGGGYSTHVVVPESQCLPVPEGFTMTEAASIPETFFTVWSNVFDRAHIQPDERFLIHGGTSGIGVAAIQMVKAMGGVAYATAGTDKKCQRCLELGATRAINYKSQDFEDILRQEGGVDVILDMVGGEYTQKNLNILNEDGRLVIINAMKNRMAEVDLMRLMVKRLTLTGSTLRARDTTFKQAIGRKLKENIWPLLEAGKIRPVVHATFSLSDAKNAHQMMESGEHIGKIVLLVEDD